MKLVDTHAHIHSADYGIPSDEAIANASAAGVAKILCVGTDQQDSQLAVDFVKSHDNCWATVGLHPHEAKTGESALHALDKLATSPKVIAIGECGLDYYYHHSPKRLQIAAFKHQLALAKDYDLPLIFHIREAFDDFFRTIAEFTSVRGVVHSFTASKETLQKILDLGLYIGLNGIMTFTKYQQQLEMAKAIPANRLLLETDSPFLTPSPKRGRINEPANVKIVAEFLSHLRGESAAELAMNTTNNAQELFGI